MKIDIKTENVGVIIKADTIGSLEALAKILESKNVPISRYGIGPITKEDVAFCEVMREKDRYLGVILGFNVKCAEDFGDIVPILTDSVIYNLLDKYEKWKEQEREKEKKEKLEKLPSPVKIQILPNCIFRRSDPAIVGVKVLAGILKPNIKLMDSEGLKVGEIKAIQDKGQSIKEAKPGAEVAISIQGGVVGRNIEEDDILYTYMTERDLKEMKAVLHLLSDDQKNVLREIAEIVLKKKQSNN
jgi:translation initiation factor 5B